jgi:hypothetical protein
MNRVDYHFGLTIYKNNKPISDYSEIEIQIGDKIQIGNWSDHSSSKYNEKEIEKRVMGTIVGFTFDRHPLAENGVQEKFRVVSLHAGYLPNGALYTTDCRNA